MKNDHHPRTRTRIIVCSGVYRLLTPIKKWYGFYMTKTNERVRDTGRSD
jgi:hypothetical protein